MRTAIAAAAWFALAAIVAVLVVGLELDREARRNAAVAPLVPEPFRAFALEPLAEAAYERRDAAQGMALSRAYVLRRPVPSEGMSLLAYGQLLGGDEQAAARSLSLAGQRGWRDRFTQDMLVVMALQAGDWNVAAQRTLALWRVGLTDDRLKDMTMHLLATPKGATAFASRLGPEKYWSDGFISWAGEALEADALQQTVAALARHGARVSCGSLAVKLPALVRSGRAVAASILWRGFCAKGAMTAPSDFRFRTLSDTRLPGPFDWQYPEVEGVESEIVPQVDGAAIRYTNRAAVRSPVARRNMVLPAGRYAVTIDADADGEAGVRPLVLRISCFSAQGAGEGYRLIDADPKTDRTGFAIPEADCASQELVLMAGLGNGEIRRVTITPS